MNFHEAFFDELSKRAAREPMSDEDAKRGSIRGLHLIGGGLLGAGTGYGIARALKGNKDRALRAGAMLGTLAGFHSGRYHAASRKK